MHLLGTRGKADGMRREMMATGPEVPLPPPYFGGGKHGSSRMKPARGV